MGEKPVMCVCCRNIPCRTCSSCSIYSGKTYAQTCTFKPPVCKNIAKPRYHPLQCVLPPSPPFSISSSSTQAAFPIPEWPLDCSPAAMAALVGTRTVLLVTPCAHKTLGYCQRRISLDNEPNAPSLHMDRPHESRMDGSNFVRSPLSSLPPGA